MASTFPTSNDSFNVPSAPSTTPLSSSGDGSRAHAEHHKDLGDAVMALEQNVALVDHTHSGTGARATPKLVQANTHQSADTDVATSSIHHTIGTSATQAAAGNHTHTGTYLRLANVNESIDGVKTFVKPPVITDLTSMQHNHSNAATGGIAVTNSKETEVAGNTPIGRNTAFLFYTSLAFTLPANVRLTGYIEYEIRMEKHDVQEVVGVAYIGANNPPRSAIDGTFYNNVFSGVNWRYPGQDNTLYPTENLLVNMHVPFAFNSIGTVRSNMGLYLYVYNSTGIPTIQIGKIRSVAHLSVTFP